MIQREISLIALLAFATQWQGIGGLSTKAKNQEVPLIEIALSSRGPAPKPVAADSAQALAQRNVSHASGPGASAATPVAVLRAQVEARKNASRGQKLPPQQEKHHEAKEVTMKFNPSRRLRLDSRSQAFIQRAAARYHRGPRPVEDMEKILGVPKIVWVIIADVVALAIVVACIPFCMYLAKMKEDDMMEPLTISEQKELDDERKKADMLERMLAEARANPDPLKRELEKASDAARYLQAQNKSGIQKEAHMLEKRLEHDYKAGKRVQKEQDEHFEEYMHELEQHNFHKASEHTHFQTAHIEQPPSVKDLQANEKGREGSEVAYHKAELRHSVDHGGVEKMLRQSRGKHEFIASAHASNAERVAAESAT